MARYEVQLVRVNHTASRNNFIGKGEEFRSKRGRLQPLSKALTGTAFAKGVQKLWQGPADSASDIREAPSARPCRRFRNPLAEAVLVRALLRGCGRLRLLLHSSPLHVSDAAASKNSAMLRVSSANPGIKRKQITVIVVYFNILYI